MFQCDNQFIEKLQEHISLSPGSGSKKLLLLIEIVNSTQLKISYDLEYLSNAIVELYQQITKLLDQVCLCSCTIDNEYIILAIEAQKEEDLQQYIEQIHSVTQSFRTNILDKPIHITSTISSLKLNTDIKTAMQAISLVCLTARNNRFDENKFHLNYQEIEENKHNFKNHFIMADCLKKALLSKKIRLAYQPIINSKNGSISHYECLLRIVNEDGRVISAGPFIPVVEAMGFINLIDEIVLEMVVHELKTSHDIIFTFNLSSIGVHNKSWLKKIKSLVSQTNLASRLIVEITETAAHKDLGKAAHFIATVQDLGCLVALDDFGSGHTSFRQLKVLPIDIVKIDGSFIKDIVGNAENQSFVKTLINMSKIFGLKTVGEFVENGEIAKLLLDFEIDYMQGNYFCPAVNYRAWDHKP